MSARRIASAQDRQVLPGFQLRLRSLKRGPRHQEIRPRSTTDKRHTARQVAIWHAPSSMLLSRNAVSPSFAQRPPACSSAREHHVVDPELKFRSDASIGPLITPDSTPDPPSSSPGAPMPATTRPPHTPHGEREQASNRHLHASVPVAGNLHDPVRHRHGQR